MDIPTAISLVVAAVSLVVAVIAIFLGIVAQRESRSNYDKTKDLLADIKQTAGVIERTVSTSETQLLETVKTLAIPERPDPDQQMGMVMLQAMMQDPEKFGPLMETLSRFPNVSSNISAKE